MNNLFFTPEFKRSLARLSKKYRSLRADIQPLLDELVDGKTPGDRLQISGAILYKVRLKNSDANRGKRGGYRVIYYLKTRQETILITLYSKTEQADISTGEIQSIVDKVLS
ncbi:type II toxin-antitoxin system RelE/ParE family toxin [Endozoicomonas sp. Mp262]|uniref:type II toxin-antitoxin system RelE/ParE family toxin n=1 Tax=Endozoicomonas sp. Mp262 TaxID=2919499 RepID=UPI0021D937AE